MGKLNMRGPDTPGSKMRGLFARANRLPEKWAGQPVSRRRALAPIAAASVALLVGCGAGASADQRAKESYAADAAADEAVNDRGNGYGMTAKSSLYEGTADTNPVDGGTTGWGAGRGGLSGVGKPPTPGTGHATLGADGTYDYQAAGFRVQNPCDIIPDEVLGREGLEELPDSRTDVRDARQDQLCGVTNGSVNLAFVSSYVNQRQSTALGYTQLHFTGPENSTYGVIREEPGTVMCTVGADTAMGFFGIAALVDEAPLYMNDVETCSYLNDRFVGYFADFPELIGPGIG